MVLRGAPLMTGYLNPSPGGAVFRGGWLQTGDEGRLDEDGYLYLRGRIGERINRGGAMVVPAEVDAALATHPDVRQAVAFGVPHPSLGQDLAAAIVLARGSDVDESELRGHLASRLDHRQIPSRIVVVDAIPVSAAGKVVRGALADALSDVLYADYSPPSGPLENTLVEIFSDVLAERSSPDRKVGRLTNFFLEGGDSLAAMRVMAGLARSGLGEHPPTVIFDNPTPAEMAVALVAECGERRGTHLVTLQAEGLRSPVVVVHGMGGQLFAYMHLARALAPDRPTLGLQCAGLTAEECPRVGVAELAERYADDILQRDLQSPIHLVGYSAGGWYAYAVAAALHERGVRIGMLALLDSHAIRHTSTFAQLPLRLRLSLIAKIVSRRIRAEGLPSYLKSVAQRRLGLLRSAVRPHLHPDPDWALALLGSYRPPRLPIAVRLFGPAKSMDRLSEAWRHYAQGGVRCHRMFEEHGDFGRSDLATQLAAALESIMAEIESAESCPRP